MSAQHTPGPWEVILPEGSNGFYYVSNPALNENEESVTGEVATCYYANAKANARLIAAAPELLEALKTALPTLDDAEQDARETAQSAREQAKRFRNRQNLDLLTQSAQRWDHVADCYRGDANAARAAIAKATGEEAK